MCNSLTVRWPKGHFDFTRTDKRRLGTSQQRRRNLIIFSVSAVLSSPVFVPEDRLVFEPIITRGSAAALVNFFDVWMWRLFEVGAFKKDI